MYEADAYYFVTVRCFQSRLLLRPTTRLADALGGVLARAARLHKIELCGFIAASNHVHLLCRARDGALSDFMKHFLCNASKKAGRLANWRGQFWERRFSAEPVLDDGALEGRLKYILAQGVKEGLVRRPKDWPGLSCLPQLLGSAKRTFRFYEWARRWEGGKLVPGGERPWDDAWGAKEELEVHPLRHWADWSVERRQARVKEWVAEIELEGRKKHRRVMGAARVAAQDPHSRPENTKRSPRPMFHAAERRLGFEYLEQYAAFVSAFKQASEKFRKGEWKAALFPQFSFRPWVPVQV